jgi:hypothetical protein
LKVSQLKLNPKNPRLIKDDKFRKLVRSIQEFPKMMSLRPIVIDDDNLVLGGNMRLRAIKELGMKEIPDDWVKKASELSDEEKRRFIIEDNVEFGEFDFDILANEWDENELVDWGIDVLNNKESNVIKEQDIIPYKKVYILLIIDPEKSFEVKKRIRDLIQEYQIEIEESAN